ncbi:hypothetical protein RCG23_16785 [Neobacillus sp. PS3-34]|nr:hypothetical protein [Neobacillus sp. PS3-34]WML47204.1 hypothetical protein RCG23_16785 [Neobacillus sp. PS3-34]
MESPCSENSRANEMKDKDMKLTFMFLSLFPAIPTATAIIVDSRATVETI